MNNWRRTIKQETLLRTGGLLLFLVVGGAVMLISLIGAGRMLDRSIVEKVNSIVVLAEFKKIILTSQQSSTAWVFHPRDREAKARLRKIIQQEGALIHLKLTSAASVWPDTNQVRSLKTAMLDFDTLLIDQKALVQLLAIERNYADPALFDKATKLAEDRLLPNSRQLQAAVARLITEKNTEFGKARRELSDNMANTRLLLVIIILIIVVPSLILTWSFATQMTSSLNLIVNGLQKLSLGEIPAPIRDKRDDELGDIGLMVNSVSESYAITVKFAEQIGQGNYEANIASLGDKDLLSNALMHMRERLTIAAEEDRRRNWANEGSAKFADLLRANNQSTTQMGTQLIAELIRYIGANQGNFFVLNDESPDDVYMELVAAYAWQKQRFADKKVLLGEGSVGQAWIERDVVYLTDVPEQYTYIGSGLGDANPRCIVIVPLLFNEQVYGILEVASFTVLPAHKIEFLNRLGASIALAISTGKGNDRTQHLLMASQQMAEQLRMQEEEMRQNLEELMATQDELQRKVDAYESEIANYEQTIKQLKQRRKVEVLSEN